MVLRGLAAVAIAIAILSRPTPARADAAEVEALIAKGNDLRRAGTPGPALPYFQKAYQLARTPRTTGQLGLAELAAGYPVEAAEHLAAALESPNDPSIVKYRQMLADALTMARSQIGELAVDGNPAGAEVVINGRVAGVLPLASTVKLPARNAEVVVRALGYVERREMVPIASGQRHQVTVNLEKVAKPTDAAPVVVAAPASGPSLGATSAAPAAAVVEKRSATDEAPSSTTRTAAWIAGGGALVAAGTGLALQLTARSNLSDFNGSCETDPTIHAKANKALSDTECQDRYDAWSWQKRWSVVGYISGAALAVTSTVLFWTSRPSPTATTTHARLTCAPTSNGIACTGVF